MPSLHEFQNDFAAAVFKGGNHVEKLLGYCGGDTGRALLGVESYRRSVLANLANALQVTYPVLQALVGHDFLYVAAHRYAQERPSTSGDLNDYGRDFDDFLSRYEPAASLPYLPDVASLEWKVQQAHFAPDGELQNLSLLAITPPESWGELRFRLDLAHHLIDSEWPVADIWEVNQPDYAGDFQVDINQAQTVLIHRRAKGVAVETLNSGERAMIVALNADKPLGDAVAAATDVKAEFDLQAALQRFIGNGLVRQVY